MADFSSEFDKTFGYLGEVFNEKSLPEPLNVVYELPAVYLESALSQARSKQGDSYPFFVKYIINGSFNAAAVAANKGGVVCIHYSVPILLFNACLLFASRCDLSTALPATDNEALIVFPEKLILDGEIRLQSDTGISEVMNLYNLCTNMISRHHNAEDIFQYALWLYEFSARFIAMHECMHIILGHTAYSKNHFGLNVFEEFSVTREEVIPIEIGQILEYLADRNSASGVLAQAFEGNMFHSFSTEPPVNLRINQTVFIGRSLINSLCILFHLLPYSMNNTLKESLYRTHPHPYIRMQWLNSIFGAQLSEEEFEEAIFRPFAFASATLSKNFLTPNSWGAVNAENFNVKKGSIAFSDWTHEQISIKANALQSTLWEHAPVYEGFTKGWKNNG